jgi:tRNA threonylcarbamoyladenosine biosynthesis protein TsaB
MFSRELRTILAFDTSAGAVSAAVLRGGNILAEVLEPVSRGHGEVVMGMVKLVVDESQIGFADLDAIVVTEGPGSFTGIRVGLAAARGLGLALGIPVLGISTLLVHAAAAAAAARASQASIMVIIDSKRADLFVQHFSADLTALGDPHLVSIDALAGEIGQAPVIVTGDAAHLLQPLPPQAVAMPAGYPAISEVGRLALATGRRSPATPLYIRAPDAARPIAGGRLR